VGANTDIRPAGERNGPPLNAAPEGEHTSGASSSLLAGVARCLHDLEGTAGSAAAELRSRVEALGPPGTPRDPSDKVTHAVVRELLQTLGERAGRIEREAELIAGILERARDQLERTRLESVPAKAAESPSIDLRTAASKDATQPPKQRAQLKRSKQTTSRHAEGKPPDVTPGKGPASANGGAPEGVRLLAVQMALSGSGTDEIAARLRSEFGVPDPAPAVEQVFGGAAS
jgi:hypothetical protein